MSRTEPPRFHTAFLVGRSLAVIALVLVLGLASIYFWFTRDCYVSLWPHSEFRSDTWKATEWHQRYKYVRSILNDDRFVGAARREVVDLLGNTDYHYGFGVYLAYPIREFADLSCGLDVRAILFFDFDREERVTAVRVFSDD